MRVYQRARAYFQNQTFRVILFCVIMGGHYFQNRKGPIIWIRVGISVIYMSSVLGRMGGAALSSIITPAKPYRWVSLSTTPDDTLMLCRGFFFVMMQSLRSCLFPFEKLLQVRRSFLTMDACIKG